MGICLRFPATALVDPMLNNITKGLLSAATPLIPDINSLSNNDATGVAVNPNTIDEHNARSSVFNRLKAVKYAHPDRLHFAFDTLATKTVLCQGEDDTQPKAIGVGVARNAGLPVQSNFHRKKHLKTEKIYAKKEVIVAAGVFQTPQLVRVFPGFTVPHGASRTSETPPRPEGAEANMLDSTNDPCPISPICPTSAAGGFDVNVTTSQNPASEGDNQSAPFTFSDGTPQHPLLSPLPYSEEPQQAEALDEDVPSLMEAENPLPAGNGDPACGSDENQEDACMDANGAGDSDSRSIDLEYAESEGAPDEGLPSSIQGQAGDAPDVASADVQDDPFEANETDVQTHVPFGQGLDNGVSSLPPSSSGALTPPAPFARNDGHTLTIAAVEREFAPRLRLLFWESGICLNVLIDDLGDLNTFDTNLDLLRHHVNATKSAASAPGMILSVRLEPTAWNKRAPVDQFFLALYHDDSLAFWQAIHVQMPPEVLRDAATPSSEGVPDDLILNSVVYSGARENVPYPWKSLRNLSLFDVGSLTLSCDVTVSDIADLSESGQVSSQSSRLLALALDSIVTGGSESMGSDEYQTRIGALSWVSVAPSVDLAPLIHCEIIPKIGLRRLAIDVSSMQNTDFMKSLTLVNFSALLAIDMRHTEVQTHLIREVKERLPLSFATDIEFQGGNVSCLHGLCVM